MDKNIFHLNIYSSVKTVCDEDVLFVELPLSSGPYGILFNHANMFSDVIGGVGYYKTTDEEIHYFATSGGVLEIKNNSVVFLARTAELAESIDVDRAKISEEKARERLRSASPDSDARKANVRLHKALARQKAYDLSKRH